MTERVYIIEDGVYSDYRVVGIFTTRENAEKAFAHLRLDPRAYDEPKIVERDLDPDIENINSGLTQYGVRIDARNNRFECQEDRRIEEEDLHWADGSWYSVWAKDEASAVKIAAERDAQHRTVKLGMA